MEFFRATRACEAVQGLADLFSMTLQSDDVQDFDVRWVHAVLTVSEMPSDMIQEGLYKSKIGRHCSTSDCYGTVRSRNGANQGAELSQIKDSCGTSF